MCICDDLTLATRIDRNGSSVTPLPLRLCTGVLPAPSAHACAEGRRLAEQPQCEPLRRRLSGWQELGGAAWTARSSSGAVPPSDGTSMVAGGYYLADTAHIDSGAMLATSSPG